MQRILELPKGECDGPQRVGQFLIECRTGLVHCFQQAAGFRHRTGTASRLIEDQQAEFESGGYGLLLFIEGGFEESTVQRKGKIGKQL